MCIAYIDFVWILPSLVLGPSTAMCILLLKHFNLTNKALETT